MQAARAASPCRALLAALAGALVLRAAGAAEWDARGTYKALAAAAADVPAAAPAGPRGTTLLADYHRLRAMADGHGERWAAEVHAEAALASGDAWPSGLAERGAALAGRPRFLDLERQWGAAEDSVRTALALDRLALAWTAGGVTVKAGRQSVSWGTGLIWSPLDLFAAFGPTAIDRDFKPGVDAVRATWAPGGDTSLDAVWEPLDFAEPGRAGGDSTLAVSGRAHAGEYDLSAVAGRAASDTVCGCDWAGYVGDAGFRGEALYTRPDRAGERPYWRGVLSADYAFTSAWQPYVAAEYAFNGYGATSPEGLAAAAADPRVARLLARGTAFGLGRHYAGAIVRVMPSALVALQAQTVYGLVDRSAREFVTLAWSAAENTDIILGANWGLGGDDTELGPGDLYYLYVKFYR